MNFSKSITPGDALRYIAGRSPQEGLRYQADQLRRDAAVLIAKADLLDEVRRDIDHQAYLFDQHQPKITPCEDPGAHA